MLGTEVLNFEVLGSQSVNTCPFKQACGYLLLKMV